MGEELIRLAKACASSCSLAALPVFAAAASNSILMRNVTVHPVTAPAIRNGSVLVVDGKIAEVGTRVGSKGMRIIDGHGLQLYPGLLNAAGAGSRQKLVHSTSI